MKEYIKQLNEIYANVPETVCARCGNCCGPIGFTTLEEENIEKYLEDEGIDVRTCIVGTTRDQVLAFTSDFKCPFLKDNECTIYPVRPIVCRLFGVIRGGRELPCKHSVCKRKLTAQYAGKLVKRVDRLNEKFLKEEAEAVI